MQYQLVSHSSICHDSPYHNVFLAAIPAGGSVVQKDLLLMRHKHQIPQATPCSVTETYCWRLQAILTLFELGTLDNWGDTLFAAITGENKQPRQNAQWQNAIFFIVFVCVSAHFMIKSFIAVFCDQVRALLPSLPSCTSPQAGQLYLWYIPTAIWS
jgi:hypothetical protein